jgi:hypothetical protein
VSASTYQSSTATPSVDPTWLHGRTLDLLFGAGLAYVVSIPVLVLASEQWGVTDWSVTAAALLALVFNIPHYGATLLRAYDRAEDRRRYALFTGWVTAAIAASFVAGLYYAPIGSLLVTLYWSWSPWHFSGQNYGLAVMFLRRRGIEVDSTTKRLLHASFFLSFVLAFLVIHVKATSTTVWARAGGDEGVFPFLSLNLPLGAVQALAPAVVAAYLGSLVAAAVRLAGRARPVDLLPVASLVLTQALWFLVPSALLLSGRGLPELVFTVIWISAAHSVQYLWVSSYYARRESPSIGMRAWFGRTLLAGAGLTWFPGLLFAPGLLGPVPWTEGLAILLFSVVNLHHFVLDGAIWKLRDGRVAQLLLRTAPADPAPVAPERRTGWLRPTLAAVGVASVAIAVVDVWEREVGIRQAQQDLPRIRQAAERLALVGRASPGLHAQIGAQLARRGDLAGSVGEFERSLAIFPTAEAWFGLGVVRAAEGRFSEARAALDAALALQPDHLDTLMHSSRTWIRLDRPDLARKELERARSLAPGNPAIERELERLDAAPPRSSGTVSGPGSRGAVP